MKDLIKTYLKSDPSIPLTDFSRKPVVIPSGEEVWIPRGDLADVCFKYLDFDEFKDFLSEKAYLRIIQKKHFGMIYGGENVQVVLDFIKSLSEKKEEFLQLKEISQKTNGINDAVWFIVFNHENLRDQGDKALFFIKKFYSSEEDNKEILRKHYLSEKVISNWFLEKTAMLGEIFLSSLVDSLPEIKEKGSLKISDDYKILSNWAVEQTLEHPTYLGTILKAVDFFTKETHKNTKEQFIEDLIKRVIDANLPNEVMRALIEEDGLQNFRKILQSDSAPLKIINGVDYIIRSKFLCKQSSIGDFLNISPLIDQFDKEMGENLSSFKTFQEIKKLTTLINKLSGRDEILEGKISSNLYFSLREELSKNMLWLEFENDPEEASNKFQALSYWIEGVHIKQSAQADNQRTQNKKPLKI